MRCIVRGTGAGQPLGILDAGCLATVAKESGQTADTVVAANLAKMWARLPGGSWPTAAWLANESTCEQLLPLANFNTGPARIFSAPLIPCEACSALGDLGDLLLADLIQFQIVDRVARVAQADLEFLSYQSAFRVTWRVAGAPMWASATTPLYGANQVTPFITLAERGE